MSLKVFGRASSVDESAHAPVENVNWLPRARLRSGGRGDKLLTALIVVTASVLAAAAGFAAWSRHGDLLGQQGAATEKAPERATLLPDRAAPPPARQASPTPAPVRNVTATPSAPAPIAPREDAVAEPPRSTLRADPAPQPAPAAPVTTIRTNPSGVPIETARERIAAAPPPVEDARSVTPDAAPSIPAAAPPPPPLPLPSSGRQVSNAPLTNFSAGSFEVLPALVGETPEPAPAPSRAAPPPQRTASAPPPPASSGGRVAVYMDEYPDQKAAAAALSQKSGAYGKYIGSAGRLTYTRRGNDWRLRVSNLDQATAEAICARMKGAGAPCSVGPN